jgi:redox-sensitive bicupin YhaK (pirin superfamily)
LIGDFFGLIVDTSIVLVTTKEATMMTIRKATERGHFNHGWLDTYHTFSFGGYYDPRAMGFRALRVINDDRVQPGAGFGTHPHEDMEIVTYVLDGALAHRDSLGNGGVIGAGELQRMTAGTGITHSEFNASQTEPVHLYQIWLFPERAGLEPTYEQRAFPVVDRRNRFALVAARDGGDGALKIMQDAKLYLGALETGRELSLPLSPDRHAWVQVLRGTVDLNGSALSAGDGAALSAESDLTVRAADASEVLVFDLA